MFFAFKDQRLVVIEIAGFFYPIESTPRDKGFNAVDLHYRRVRHFSHRYWVWGSECKIRPMTPREFEIATGRFMVKNYQCIEFSVPIPPDFFHANEELFYLLPWNLSSQL